MKLSRPQEKLLARIRRCSHPSKMSFGYLLSKHEERTAVILEKYGLITVSFGTARAK